MIKVSIIVPVYNAEKFLSKCLRSILSQNYKNFELILVNDGSQDNSLSIMQRYSERDSRILILNKENEGCIKARQSGLIASSGEYVMFVDADDYLTKDTLSLFYEELRHFDFDIVVGNMYKVISRGITIRKKNNSNFFESNKTYSVEEVKNKLVTAYFHGHPFPSSLCGKLYKKELLLNNGKFLKEINFFGEDLYYNLEILLKVNTVRIIPNYIYNYRAGGNTSKYMPYLFKDMIAGFNIQKRVIKELFEGDESHLNGISVMLLNTYKTYLTSLFSTNFAYDQIIQEINNSLKENVLIEATNTEGARKVFPIEYISALQAKDSQYLYRMGKIQYNKGIIKRLIKQTLAM